MPEDSASMLRDFRRFLGLKCAVVGNPDGCRLMPFATGTRLCDAPQMIKDLSPVVLNIHHDHIPSPSLANDEGLELLHSVEEFGILVPLLVTERAPNDYLIVDGVRRYLCAKELGLETVPCRVRGPVQKKDFHLLRWEIHHTHLPWTQEERDEWSKKFHSKG
jgi:hypothetical protein